MSIPRYSCIESVLTTSPATASASSTASSLLPAAVGPTTATTGVLLTGQVLPNPLGARRSWPPDSAVALPYSHEVADSVRRLVVQDLGVEDRLPRRAGQYLPGCSSGSSDLAGLLRVDGDQPGRVPGPERRHHRPVELL